MCTHEKESSAAGWASVKLRRANVNKRKQKREAKRDVCVTEHFSTLNDFVNPMRSQPNSAMQSGRLNISLTSRNLCELAR